MNSGVKTPKKSNDPKITTKPKPALKPKPDKKSKSGSEIKKESNNVQAIVSKLNQNNQNLEDDDEVPLSELDSTTLTVNDTVKSGPSAEATGSESELDSNSEIDLEKDTPKLEIPDEVRS